MNKKTDKGIILSRTDFGERDRILTVLLKENGKARLVAKGVRTAKSKMAGGIELFSESQLGFIQGRSEMFTLTSSRLVRHFGCIVEDYNKTELAYDILRTVNKTVDDGAGQEYYSLVLCSLEYLDNKNLTRPTVAIWFYLNLLELMGISINLKTDKNGKTLEEAEKYSFDKEDSCFYPNNSGVFSKDLIKLLRYILDKNKPVESEIPAKQQDSAVILLSQMVKEAVG